MPDPVPPAKRPFGLSETEKAAMARFQAWCFAQAEKGRWGREILYTRCDICGAEEFTDGTGRLTIRHVFSLHYRNSRDHDAFEMAPPARIFGGDDELERGRQRRTYGDRG